MNIVNHSKCQKCKKISNVSDLKKNDHGIGLVCSDEKSCKERIKKNRTIEK